MEQERDQWLKFVNGAREEWARKRAEVKRAMVNQASALERSISNDTVSLTSAAIAIHDREKRKALLRLRAETETAARVRMHWR